jgi:transposase InsO family protein
MDFLEALPKFEPLSHPFATKNIVQVFHDNAFKLHGLPLAIITDRDKIFTSELWQDLFKSLNVKLRFSGAYHPQIDGQSERVNQCLENYLRCMVF